VGGRTGLSDRVLNAYLDHVRQITLDEIQTILPREARGAGGLYSLMRDYPLRYGKSLRPAIAVATCRAHGGALSGVLATAATLELFHNAFLIHDDIEDQSYLRRDEETLNRKHGVATAINVGDAMLAATIPPLLDNIGRIGLGRALRILRIVERMARESAEGQMLELTWIAQNAWDQRDMDYVRLVHKKTGWYSFIAPALAGAVVAGLDDEKAQGWARAFVSLGVAFQIQDDVLNLTAAPEGYGKDFGGDLWEGKHTLILMEALRRADPVERERALSVLARPHPGVGGLTGARGKLDELFARGAVSEEAYRELLASAFGEGPAPKTDADVVFMRDMVERTGALDYARAVAGRHARRARREIGRRLEALPASDHKTFLLGVAEFAVDRAH
jgi:geranylgeranyl diphosphate synthase type II